MDAAAFIAFLREYFPLSPLQEERFAALDGLYRSWNAKINVISRKDIDFLYDHHVLHCLSIARWLSLREDLMDSFSKGTVLDLGTGGGFPGIPLAILFPETRFTLCDSVGKKTLVASEVASALGLDNVEVVNARAESLGRRFDFVVSRAVASLTDFYPWVKGTYSKAILYLKGGDINEEIAAVMARYRLNKGSVSTWPLSSWLSDPYYDGKLLLAIQ